MQRRMMLVALVGGVVAVLVVGVLGTALASHRLPIQRDADQDGCYDDNEKGSDPTLGGDRDNTNPWDWYDVARAGGTPFPDQVIDLANDVLGVIDHFAPLGTEPEYDVNYDRGPWTGANSWKGTTAPDGVIDLANDIMGVIGQFNHDCTRS